jgi:hypothetical protein
MSAKTKRATTKTEANYSRAALWTIQHAVDALADSIRHVQMLRDYAHRSHSAALVTLRMARHHTLNDGDLRLVEDCVGKLAQRMDWPASLRTRTRQEHLERPLSETESSEITNLAGGALGIASGTLDIEEQMVSWYGGFAVAAVAAARSALSSVTAVTHRRRADKLMHRLEQLCDDHRIAWAFVAGAEHKPISHRTLH